MMQIKKRKELKLKREKNNFYFHMPRCYTYIPCHLIKLLKCLGIMFVRLYT